ncbi:MAG TPA: PRC-barrel domain-containing protein [Actinomycetes bacterium]|nr:PRC-barrel domain-containing protein [Actinomycetes bacterium]
MPTIDRETLDRWRTLAIVDRTGGTVGNVVEFYLDRGTGQPTWALVNTALFGARETFVPLLHATEVSDGLQVPYEKGHIKDAPHVDVLDELGPDEEATLIAHYGIEYAPAAEPPPADPGLVEPVATPGEADAEATAAPTAEPSARPLAEPSASTSTEPTAEASGEPDAESSRQADTDATLRPEAEPSAGSTAEPDAEKPTRDGSATEATAGTASTAGEPPPAPGEAGWAPGEAGDFERPSEPVGHDADLRHDDETAVEDARRDEAASPGEEPSMLERARRRLEGLVSGPGPASPAEASRDAEDADRVHGEHPATDRDRR